MVFPGNLREGVGTVIPGRFDNPNQQEPLAPDVLFPPSISTRATPMVHRFIHRQDNRCFLVYTAGSDRGRFRRHPRAGCGFVFAPTFTGNPIGGAGSFLVEERGPTGSLILPSYERACIRAVIGVLRAKDWVAEGCNRLVVATNSPFIVNGATRFITNWIRFNWINQAGDVVKNRDLWLCLQGEIEKLYARGLTIQFWLISRQCNNDAENLALQAVEMDDWITPQDFTDRIYMSG
ncbi:ribonuclease H-like domain-containing protein [Penicillium angulare]|uniref:ribonuclease H-like domain-containing protein n=1 Tax=Penicillium angulare TaxID=116970 RepID=UPI002541C049|nr:ribonuclease H-like domain-containing protein [Penicillium angulare]KAJ5281630.1 ribonuclease H-like domain-containing protein [Penicillium angulare]